MKLFFLLVICSINSISLVFSDEANEESYIDEFNRQKGGNDDHHHHHHVKVENVDSRCTNSGMMVTVDFDGAFNGLIYSKGHFSNPKCRYVKANSGSKTYSFVVPANDCGSQDKGNGISNVLIFQMDEAVQEIWDTAKEVSCKSGTTGNKPNSKHGKMVIFKPLTVGMLNVLHQPISNGEDGLNCWMDIQKGAYPNKAKTDRTLEKTFDTGNTGATIIAFTNMTAFKFPNTDNVHLTCNIEVCKDACEDSCVDQSTPKKPSVSTPGNRKPPSKFDYFSPNAKPNQPTYNEPQKSYEKSRPGSYDNYNPAIVSNNLDCSVDVNNPRCQKESPSTKLCYPGQVDPRCPPVCGPGSSDRRCQQPTSPAPLKCYQGSTDPRCPQQEVPSRQPSPPKGTNCYPGSRDPRCPQEPPSQQRETTQRYQPTDRPQTTAKIPLCYPGQVDPRCPPECGPGSTDRRCQQSPSQAPFRCYEGSLDPRCPQKTTQRQPTTTRAPVCYPGSTDSRCPKEPTATTRPYSPTQRVTTQRYQTERPQTTPKAPLCYPGAVDPRCPPECGPGSTDRRCQQQTTPAPLRCYEGSTDPRCPQPERPRQPSTTRAPNCYPGSSDPRCPKETTTSRPYSPPQRVTTQRYQTERPYTFSFRNFADII